MTTVLMGPYATQLLGDMGADVIKIEAPAGDLVRDIAPMANPRMGAMYLHINRSKRSLVLDVKQPAGREALLRLLARADVLIYNVRPQAMERLGLSYEAVAAVNPRILYVGTFGFGQDGPYAARPAFDDLIQGAIGLPALVARVSSDGPRYVPSNIADRTVGVFAVAAVSAGLYHRAQTGHGQRIDVPMFETMTSHLLGDHIGGQSFDPPRGPPGYLRLLASERRPYRTSDGYVCTVIYTDKQWRDFFTAVGRPGFMESDPRFTSLNVRTQHMNDLHRIVGDIFIERTTAEWIEALMRADIPVMPLHTLDTIFDDPHLKAVGFFEWEEHPSEGRVRRMRAPYTWSDSQPVSSRPAPRLGEHSAEVLREAGYSDAEIATLVARGVTYIESSAGGD